MSSPAGIQRDVPSNLALSTNNNLSEPPSGLKQCLRTDSWIIPNYNSLPQRSEKRGKDPGLDTL